MTVSQVTDPCALRRVPVGSIPRDVARVPTHRIERGWRVLIEGRWFTVAGSRPEGDGVQLLIIAAAAPLGRRRPTRRASVATLPRENRLWARAPRDGDVQTLGCVREDCASTGPFELTDEGLLCATHLNGLLSAIHDYVYEGDEHDG